MYPLPCLPSIPMVLVADFAVSATADAADDTWLFTASAARPSVDALRWLADSVCVRRRSPCILVPISAAVRFRRGLDVADASALNLSLALHIPVHSLRFTVCLGQHARLCFNALDVCPP